MSEKLREMLSEIVQAAEGLGKDVTDLRRDEYLTADCRCVGSNRQIINHGGWHELITLAAEHLEDTDNEESDFFITDEVPEAETYVITWAQNATEICPTTLGILEKYCEHNDAKLMVIPGRYKNTLKKDDYWWDAKLVPYLTKGRLKIGEHCVAYGDISIQPTAVTPLSGFEVFAGSASAIFGHPKLQLRTVASEDRMARIFTTTGAVTKKNYREAKAGARAAPHHIFGAAIVEICGGLFHLRQFVVDENGEAYDLDKVYTHDGVRDAESAAVFVPGDLHVEKMTQENKDSIEDIIDFFKPENIVVHDVLDFDVRNHHRRNDLVDRIKRAHGHKVDLVEDEVFVTCEYLYDLSKCASKLHVVRSNHDEAFERWLNETWPMHDPLNAPFWFKTWAAMSEEAVQGNTINPFEYWFRKWDSQDCDNVRFLGRNEPLKIKDIAFNFHGDKGINGARGSLNQFSKLGTKSVIGHAHCMTLGHSALVRNKGWTELKDVAVGDYVLAERNGIRSWSKVLDTIKGKYTGSLITIGSKKQLPFRQQVTTGHRLKLTDGKYYTVCQAIATKSPDMLPITGFPVADVPEYPVTDTEIRQAVAACADGSWQSEYYLRFNIIKERKKRRLEELFGGDLCKWLDKDGRGAQRASVRTGSASWCSLKKLISCKKTLPIWLAHNLSNRQKELLLEEVTLWDGWKDGNSYKLSSSDIETLDTVSCIAAQLGYRVSVKYPQHKNSGVVTWCVDRSSVHIGSSPCDKERLEKWQVSTKEVQDTDVYCLTTEDGNFLVKEQVSGNVSITGNSPGIRDDAWQTGVGGPLDMGYNYLPSSWMNTHCIVYANGKRCLINVMAGGKWRKRVN